MAFKFPEDQEAFYKIHSVDELKQSLNNQAHSLGMRSVLYNICYLKNRYIYLKCRRCRAHLRYKKVDEDEFVLSKFCNNHNHEQKNSNCSYFKNISNIIEQFPENITKANAKSIIKQQFPIKDSTFYYLFKKIKQKKLSFLQFVANINKDFYHIRYNPYPILYEELPQIFLLVTEQMKKDYLNFGQVVSFDITYNVIKQKLHNKSFGLGIFGGKSGANHVLIFGVALMLNEDTNSMCTIFQNFFQVMETPPQTILSDQQHSISAALNILREKGVWEGVHNLDTWHLLKNLKKSLRGSDLLRNELRDALMSENVQILTKIMKNIKFLIKNEEEAQIVHQFEIKLKKSSFAIVRPSFVGFCISTGFAQKINDLIKSRIPYQVSLTLALRKIISLSHNMHQKSLEYRICKMNYEILFKNPSLKQLRYSVSDYVYQKIIRNYADGLVLKPQKYDENKWLFINSDNQTIDATVILSSERLLCDCGYQAKTMTPCLHQLNLITFFHDSIIQYIGERWKIKTFREINKEKEQQQCIKRMKPGHPKSTRRNFQR